ncbi:MAG TPA: peptidylprolyl isomerase [Ramlibacter sp.]|jgi:peptidyl-prolyl cis-trans isomerase SurA|uniref:peptidylprolyl isomerase n=1 Tax=Ramlibacter sp. TaxID=1917967 RepID=UPI002D6A0657|nr:peptidylprolyl isomerase [Ramlibacter sp.]HZY17175.1 peptidylprolyl isomerase [Ramlibacter sp.]
MRPRALALVFACTVAALPASAQLRVSPQLPGPAPVPRADSGPRPADFIVAVVNSEPITNNELRARLQRFEQQLAQQGASIPPRGELARVVLDRLISEKAQLQVARESGIRVDEAMVDQAEANVARQNEMSVADLRRRLQADGVPTATFREELRNQLLLGRLRDREVESRVRVTDADIDQYLRDQQTAAADPASSALNLAQVLVAVPENASEQQVRELLAKAQRVQERARAGEDFAALAREASDAPGAASNGGVMGLRAADRYPPLFLEAVQALPQGGVSQVVRSGAGFHVLKVVEKRQGELPTTVTQSHARHILLRTGARLSETAARERLADLRRRITAGQADFAQLAREFSQDGTASRGGDLGWANPGSYVPEFEDAMNALAPGEVSEPLVSRFGVHLIQLLERRTAKLSPREQRELLRNIVREKKLDEAYATWAQEVRGRAFVEMRESPI